MLCSRPALCNQLLSHSETYDMLILSFKHFTEDAIARKSAFEWVGNSTVCVLLNNFMVYVLLHRLFQHSGMLGT